MKTAQTIFLAMVSIVLLAAFVSYLIMSRGYFASEELNQLLEQERLLDVQISERVKAANRALPIMVDQGTRLESVDGDRRTINYNFTMVDYTDSELAASEFHKRVPESSRRTVCGSSEFQEILAKGIAISFNYSGKNGNRVATGYVISSHCE